MDQAHFYLGKYGTYVERDIGGYFQARALIDVEMPEEISQKVRDYLEGNIGPERYTNPKSYYFDDLKRTIENYGTPLTEVVGKVIENSRYSRRAVLTLFEPHYIYEEKPNVFIEFQPRFWNDDGNLVSIPVLSVRSLDMVNFFRENVEYFTALNRDILERLELEVEEGPLTMMVNNAHIYEKDLEKGKRRKEKLKYSSHLIRSRNPNNATKSLWDVILRKGVESDDPRAKGRKMRDIKVWVRVENPVPEIDYETFDPNMAKLYTDQVTGRMKTDHAYDEYERMCGEPFDQVEGILRNIEKNPNRRRHLIMIGRKGDINRVLEEREIPCPRYVVLQPEVEDEKMKLNPFIGFRSNDAYGAFPYDWIAFNLFIREKVMEPLSERGYDVEMGPLDWESASMHIYGRDMEKLKFMGDFE
ncbi:MAG: hypothetical protein DRP11_04865 [Candidatus Aenigmatarchaeota archaeon]|nr:MAG: hypothetical protein DRP11_04865 [Candidatus Aenigmarchaeota archaeon]